MESKKALRNQLFKQMAQDIFINKSMETLGGFVETTCAT